MFFFHGFVQLAVKGSFNFFLYLVERTRWCSISFLHFVDQTFSSWASCAHSVTLWGATV